MGGAAGVLGEGRSRAGEGLRFGGLGILSQLFTDVVFLLSSKSNILVIVIKVHFCEVTPLTSKHYKDRMMM